MFDKTRKFVEDTQYLCSIILSNEFYDTNGFFHKDAMRRYEIYCKINEEDLPKEVDSAPIQICFDDYKRLLNKIEIPDTDIIGLSYYIQENLTTDDSLRLDAVGIFETIIERCGMLRLAVFDFMALYDLKDNSPKLGFLRPSFMDEVEHTPDESEKKNLHDSQVPDNIANLFPDKDKCFEFLYPDKELNTSSWGRRFKEYARPIREWQKGDVKMMYEYLKQLYPKLKTYDTFQTATR